MLAISKQDIYVRVREAHFHQVHISSLPIFLMSLFIMLRKVNNRFEIRIDFFWGGGDGGKPFKVYSRKEKEIQFKLELLIGVKL